MIDRTARDQVIEAFEDIPSDRIAAFDFDERLQDVESEDQKVNACAPLALVFQGFPSTESRILRVGM